MTALEWEIISSHDIYTISKLSDEPLEPIDGFLDSNNGIHVSFALNRLE